MVVSLDNTGDFCSVQGAIDAIPAANATPVTVTVKNGTYREIVFINAKHQITLHGEDRKTTVIAYANNNTLQTQAGGVGGTANRAMVEVERSNDLVIENLTLHNLTPQGGSQAEALRIEPGDRAILRDADLISLQDTILISGRAYVTNCFIEGNTDFIWGKGVVYFDKCEIKAVVKKGYNVQARNLASAYGYVFVDSKLTSSPGLTGHMLARVDGSAYPASHVAYINCELGSHIDPLGWVVTGTTDTSMLRYWEYKSVDPTGAPIDVSERIAASRQLTDDEASMMRDKAIVFGSPAWNPLP
jgi:pectin methylesterase-like acyl-CoA thioesterase